MPSSKEVLRQALLDALAAELERQVAAAHLARDEAVNEESRAESKWDTRGQEAAYLAEGQARLAAEIREAMSRIQTLPLADSTTVQLGSVVELARGDETLRAFIAPVAGGTDFLVESDRYTVITPASPLGRLLLNRRAGDTVELPARPRPLSHRIMSVA